MFRIGIVTNIDESTAKARVQFAQDDILSYWLPVMQTKTQSDKFYALPDINEHVVCLVDEKCEQGVILGSIYSKADIVPIYSANKFHIKFSDGTTLEYDKKEHSLSADVAGIANIKATAINIEGDINHTGTFNNTDGINSDAEITDHTNSMQSMRDAYNPHTHTGNQGSPTSPPDGGMS